MSKLECMHGTEVEPGVVQIVVSTPEGEVLDSVVFCNECLRAEATQKAINLLGLQLGSLA